VADGPPSPIARTRGDGAMIGALVSFDAEPDVARALAEVIEPSTAHRALYRVSTAIPVDRERTWPLGTPSPGAKQVTFLRRKPGMTDPEFFHAWFEVHTPLAMEVHPLWRYVRSVCEEAVTEGAPPVEGIVELQFRSVDDVLDPARFYGGKAENPRRITRDVMRWIDFDTIDVAHMNEIVLR
jgi:hypothetical protein